MKKNYTILSAFASLVIALGAMASFTGCASTATRESTGEYIDNTVLTAKVKAALAADDTVNALAVNIESFKGVVQLSGFVDTAEQKAQAGRVASGVQGVESVQNNISVKTSSSG